MRQNLLRAERSLLSYPIREVVMVAYQIQKLNHKPMIWENIGDPVMAGETVPDWISKILHESISKDEIYAYTDSRGDIVTRQYVLDNFSDKNVCKLDDIIFFNGLGEAINKIFNNLPRETRVLVPSPTYPSHATAEAMHAGCSFISYQLDPENDWQPDVLDIENRVKYNDHVVGILVINPNNPTGSVHSRDLLEQIVAIAKKHNCFLLFDEIYNQMVFEGETNTLLHQIIGDVPGISLKGMSKDVPWPGSRCGWIEVYNIDADEDFKAFIDMIMLAKMLEVCSTTLPQKVLPEIFSDERFKPHLKSRINKYQRRALEGYEFFQTIANVRVNKPKGVFYLMVELLDLPKSKLSNIQANVRQYLDTLETDDLAPDFQFAYELMAAYGVCVVPLTGFCSKLTGFRMTLLQEDDEIFSLTLRKIGEAINEYYSQ